MRFKIITSAIALCFSMQLMAQTSVDFESIDRTNFDPSPQGAPLPSACSVEAAVSQAFVNGEFGSAFTSDVGFNLLTADTYVDGAAIAPFPAGEEITNVTVWGLQLEFDPAAGFIGPCDPDQADFEITTWTDNAGVPDIIVASGVATPAVTDLQIPFSLGATVQEFDIPVSNVSTDGATWFSVQRQVSPLAPGGGTNQCIFLWVNQTNAANGDNSALTINLGTSALTLRDADVSACVDTAEGAVLPVSQPVPINNFWALSLMILLMAGLGLVMVRRFV